MKSSESARRLALKQAELHLSLFLSSTANEGVLKDVVDDKARVELLKEVEKLAPDSLRKAELNYSNYSLVNALGIRPAERLAFYELVSEVYTSLCQVKEEAPIAFEVRLINILI